jgi:hypothetical protein
MIGLSLGLIIGIRLGLTAVESGIKTDIYNLKLELDRVDSPANKCTPPIPFDFNDSDLEKENNRKPQKMPPIRL